MNRASWSQVRCKNDEKLMASIRRDDGNFDIVCEKCWDSFVSDRSDGLSRLSEQDGKAK